MSVCFCWLTGWQDGRYQVGAHRGISERARARAAGPSRRPRLARPPQPTALARLAAAGCLALVLAICLAACGGSGATGGGATSADETDGPAYTVPDQVQLAPMDEAAATAANDSAIDTSHVADGYVSAHATSDIRLKFLVTSGDQTYAYDIPGDGTPTSFPLNMGDGAYTFRVMRNTSGNNYVEINSAAADVSLSSEFAPYLRPNVFCNYTADSACVARAAELAADAKNEGDVVRAVFDFVTENVTYDNDKAAELANAEGYIPDPDETLASGTGICFDYASLGAAMLRSLGIPTQIVTGYVSPSNIYHAWIMVYIDGSWHSARLSVDPDTWTRVDLTFAAGSGSTDFVGDGKDYTDRFIY